MENTTLLPDEELVNLRKLIEAMENLANNHCDLPDDIMNEGNDVLEEIRLILHIKIMGEVADSISRLRANLDIPREDIKKLVERIGKTPEQFKEHLIFTMLMGIVEDEKEFHKFKDYVAEQSKNK